MNRRHRNCIRKVRSFRGADGEKDHYLVTASIKVQLSRVWNKRIKGKPKLDTEKLKDIETRRNFQMLISYLVGNDSSSLSKNVDINQDNDIIEEDCPLRHVVQPEITEPDEEEIKQINYKDAKE